MDEQDTALSGHKMGGKGFDCGRCECPFPSVTVCWSMRSWLILQTRAMSGAAAPWYVPFRLFRGSDQLTGHEVLSSKAHSWGRDLSRRSPVEEQSRRPCPVGNPGGVATDPEAPMWSSPSVPGPRDHAYPRHTPADYVRSGERDSCHDHTEPSWN